MTSRSELTLFERGEIIGVWKCGLSEGKIAEALERAPSTVHKVIVAYRDYQQEKSSARPGRPKKITPRDSRAVKRILQKNRQTTLNEIKENFTASTAKSVCANTLRNHLHENSLYGQVGVRKPLVTKKNQIKRLSWAKER